MDLATNSNKKLTESEKECIFKIIGVTNIITIFYYNISLYLNSIKTPSKVPKSRRVYEFMNNFCTKSFKNIPPL